MDQNTAAKITAKIKRTVAAATVRLIPKFSVNADNTCPTITVCPLPAAAGLALSLCLSEFMKITLDPKASPARWHNQNEDRSDDTGYATPWLRTSLGRIARRVAGIWKEFRRWIHC